MKFYATIVFAVIAVVGTVQGRVASTGIVNSHNSNEIDRQCQHEAIENTQFTVPFILLNLQYECYKPSAMFLSQLNLAANTDAYRRIFQKACSQVASVRECIAGVASESNMCLNTMEGKMFSTVRDFVETSIDVTCSNESESVSVIYGDELKPLNFGSQMRVLSCMTAVATKTEYKSETDMPAYTMRRYRAIQDGKHCMLSVAKGKSTGAVEFEKYANKLIKSMKCISPVTTEIVLCESLETDDMERVFD